jgi:KTSC domain
MIRTPVASSNLSSIGYDPIQQILEVQFLQHPSKQPGDIYDYFQVSQTIYQGLLDAPSKGHYLYEVIKRGGYQYQKVFDIRNQIGEPSGTIGLPSLDQLMPNNIVPPTATPVIAPLLAGAVTSLEDII